jgi:hypothetical protein
MLAKADVRLARELGEVRADGNAIGSGGRRRLYYCCEDNGNGAIDVNEPARFLIVSGRARWCTCWWMPLRT